MVWGGFFSHCVGWLMALWCHNLLQNHALQSAQQLFGILWPKFISKHTAYINKRYLTSKAVDVLPWPAQLPDLNPIENLWSILDGWLKNRKPKNEGEPFNTLAEAWYVPTDLLNRLVDSMPPSMWSSNKKQRFFNKVLNAEIYN